VAHGCAEDGREPITTLVPLAITLGERALSFEVDARRAERAWFALGVRKSGSSIFSSVVNALALFNRIHTVDIPGAMFSAGVRYVEWNNHPRLADLLWRGNVYIGFRDPPTALYADPVFREGKKILMVRDPRDALVSEYFSNAFSHSLPTEQTGSTVLEQERAKALQSNLEAYVLDRAEHLDLTVAGYRRLIGDPNLLVLRYEDVIFDKALWIREIAGHFGWEASDELIANILGWADVRPDAENPQAFVRRVAPGDHLDKLSAGAIATVNGRLSDIWSEFGYALGR
jgi:hypothetical protein